MSRAQGMVNKDVFFKPIPDALRPNDPILRIADLTLPEYGRIFNNLEDGFGPAERRLLKHHPSYEMIPFTQDTQATGVSTQPGINLLPQLQAARAPSPTSSIELLDNEGDLISTQPGSKWQKIYEECRAHASISDTSSTQLLENAEYADVMTSNKTLRYESDSSISSARELSRKRKKLKKGPHRSNKIHRTETPDSSQSAGVGVLLDNDIPVKEVSVSLKRLPERKQGSASNNYNSEDDFIIPCSAPARLQSSMIATKHTEQSTSHQATETHEFYSAQPSCTDTPESLPCTLSGDDQPSIEQKMSVTNAVDISHRRSTNGIPTSSGKFDHFQQKKQLCNIQRTDVLPPQIVILTQPGDETFRTTSDSGRSTMAGESGMSNTQEKARYRDRDRPRECNVGRLRASQQITQPFVPVYPERTGYELRTRRPQTNTWKKQQVTAQSSQMYKHGHKSTRK